MGKEIHVLGAERRREQLNCDITGHCADARACLGKKWLGGLLGGQGGMKKQMLGTPVRNERGKVSMVGKKREYLAGRGVVHSCRAAPQPRGRLAPA